MAQPPAPPGSKCEHQHMLLRAALCLAPCRALGSSLQSLRPWGVL